ncbi:hypothetical protein ACVWVY_003860 [Bradyrhizobium sp. URHC0002]
MSRLPVHYRPVSRLQRSMRCCFSRQPYSSSGSISGKGDSFLFNWGDHPLSRSILIIDKWLAAAVPRVRIEELFEISEAEGG